MGTGTVRVLVWNENVDEARKPNVLKIYPDGLHGALAAAFADDARFDVTQATMDRPSFGLSDAALERCDVLVWWSHQAFDMVPDDRVESVRQRVQDGMGLIVLHSGFLSKIFKALMGTSCDLKWRNAGETERLWVVAPGHPIVEGIGEYIDLANEEMYGEPFDVPVPDELIFVSWFQGGEIFRSGCCYRRGKGRIFYFRPGHEDYPTYWNADIQTVLRNAVRWAAPVPSSSMRFGHHPPIEPTGSQPTGT